MALILVEVSARIPEDVAILRAPVVRVRVGEHHEVLRIAARELFAKLEDSSRCWRDIGLVAAKTRC
jgi:sirohydrochlorin ferrochelatase